MGGNVVVGKNAIQLSTSEAELLIALLDAANYKGSEAKSLAASIQGKIEQILDNNE